jgi:hypothetical protein
MVLGACKTLHVTVAPLRPIFQGGLIVLMALGSLVLWIGSPLGWLWIASQMSTDTQSPGTGPYVLVLVGIVITGVAMAKALQWLNRVYGRVSGQAEPVRVRLPWHRSVRGENEGRAERTVLDVVMVISVAIGASVVTVWFFFFAGSSLPTS